MNKLHHIFLIAVLSIIMATNTATAQDGLNLEELFEAKEFISEEGDTLLYRMMLPDEMVEGESYPLVLFLHGAGERGNDNTAQLEWGVHAFANSEFREWNPAIVIAPQVPEGSYWGNQNWREDGTGLMNEPSTPLELAHQLVLQTAENYPVDKNRLYITGLSMGGFGTWDMITRYPDLFAAAIPICGGGDPTKAHLLVDLPIWNFHGSKDAVVPPELSRDMIEAIRIAGGSPGYTEYPDTDHFSWIPAYADAHVLEWLFNQRKEYPAE
jgi:predicted peptidase